VSVKEDGLRAWIWSKRWLILREQSLSFYKSEVSQSYHAIKLSFESISLHPFTTRVHLFLTLFAKSSDPQTNTTAASNVIQLHDLSSVTREDLKPFCISLVTSARTFYLALKSDEELYGWMDEIYARSPLMGVSSPTNFVHQVHVGFDPVSGAFTGLPEQWTRLLTSSAITKEDYAKNPQAVLDVLEFYTDIQKRERDDYGMGTTGMGMTEVGSTLSSATGNKANPPARFGAGTGFAGRRDDAPDSSLPSRPPPPHSQPSQSSLYNSPSPPTTSSLNPSTMPPRPPPSAPISSSNFTSSNYIPPTSISSPSNPSAPRSAPNRPHLVPGRAAPPAPSSSGPPREGLPSSNGLKPLLTSSASRSNLKEPSSSAPRSIPADRPALATKPLQLPTSNNRTDPSATPSSNTSQAKPVASAPVHKQIQSTKKAGEGERRISSMSESQIMAKLRSVCSREDPNLLYSKIKKVGQGASGSVFVAKVLAAGTKVAIKQMDLSHQPRKELIVNEILVMKESQHPNIVNFLDSFLVNGAELWVVMEFMEGGALTDIIDSNSLEEEQISSICNEVRLALPFLRNA